VLREGNAGSNTAADHVRVGDLALAQLPAWALDGEIVARVDGAGATHDFTRWCRDAVIGFSVGAKLTEDVLCAARLVGDEAWKQGILKDGSENPDAFVCELTRLVNIDAWPKRSRLICRAVRLDDAIQLTFGEEDGYRYEVFLTDLPGDIRDRDLFHRGHTRTWDRVRDGKACGLENLPFQGFANNEVWLLLVQLAQDLLAWSQALLLTGDLKRAEPATLRYRLWHTAARISRHARTTRLRLDCHWPWATELAAAFTRLQALQHLNQAALSRPAPDDRPSRAPARRQPARNRYRDASTRPPEPRRHADPQPNHARDVSRRAPKPIPALPPRLLQAAASAPYRTIEASPAPLPRDSSRTPSRTEPLLACG
jgi:Transposase DDE domain group 1